MLTFTFTYFEILVLQYLRPRRDAYVRLHRMGGPSAPAAMLALPSPFFKHVCHNNMNPKGLEDGVAAPLFAFFVLDLLPLRFKLSSRHS